MSAPLIPRYSVGSGGGVVFHELSRPRYPRVKFQWLFDRAPSYLRAWIAKHCHAARHRRRRSSSPVGFRPVWNNVTRIFDGLVCLRPPPRHRHPVEYPCTDSSSSSLKRSFRLIQGARNRSIRWFHIYRTLTHVKQHLSTSIVSI